MEKPISLKTKASQWASKILGKVHPASFLCGDGGRRQYIRLNNAGYLVLAGPDSIENMAWLRIGRHLYYKGLAIPKILAYDLKKGFFLLEDLGDQQLASFGEFSKILITHYYQAVELAARFHIEGRGGFELSWCQDSRYYSAAMVEKKEINYFLNSFLLTYLKFSKLPKGLGLEVKKLAASAASPDFEKVLIHRDYQGRNLMLSDRGLNIIDWQGARMGPAVYDLTSLMEETPALALSAAFKEDLLKHYLKSRGLLRQHKAYYDGLTIVSATRMMQAVAAYAKLSLSGKEKFTTYIKPSLFRLREILSEAHFKNYPLLRSLVDEASEVLYEKISLKAEKTHMSAD